MDVPVSATFIFVDRRKTGRGKSLPNREKLLKRIRDSIKNAKPEDLDASGVGGATSSASKEYTNPVAIARDALNEPTFCYASGTGQIEVVLPGNDVWMRGDEFPIEFEEIPVTGQGNNGSDDFVINISRSEFFDVFFSDCELPDLEQSSEKEMPEAVLIPAGFQKEGNPGQLSVIRSYRNALGRRRALTLDDREELDALQLRLDDLMLNDKLRDEMDHDQWVNEVQAITDRQKQIRDRISALPLFEKVDHRYRKTERAMVKSADATLIMAMDVSGSMTKEKKRTARKFFSLQYAFIKRKYPNTDLVFIYHTDEAEECNEETFFNTRVNGGTQISPAIALANKIIKERYDAAVTNIYFTYCGDCDNYEGDNRLMMGEFEDTGFLGKVRHAVVVQVGGEIEGWGGHPSGQLKCWTALTSIAKTHRKMNLVKIDDDSEVFEGFRKIYGKKVKQA